MNQKDRREVDEAIAHYLHTHQRRERAPLQADHVERILRHMSNCLHSKAGFGVTITQDHNGAWGPMGQRLLTLRFGMDTDDHIEVSMVVRSISSYGADEAHMAYLQEDK